MMTCTHTDRPNVLSLPSLGNPHCCRECFKESAFTPYQSKREAWDHAGYDYTVRGNNIVYRDHEGVHYGNDQQQERLWK